MFLPALALQPEPFSAFSTPQRAVSLQAILHGTRNPTVSTSNVHVIELSQGCRTAVELLFKRTEESARAGRGGEFEDETVGKGEDGFGGGCLGGGFE